MTVDLWARRPLFTDDHEDFRASVRNFAARHVADHVAQWEDAAAISREVWQVAGAQGLLGANVPQEYGGGGVLRDFGFRVAAIEELARIGASSLNAGTQVHADIVLPYLVNLCTPEQAKAWLPALCSGEQIGAIAMTEPGAGSDLQGIRTSGRRDGTDWLINGSKTFITNGVLGDLVIVAVRTDPDPAAGRHAFTLMLIERGMPGFERGRKLDKLGLRAQDTAELHFTDVRVPAGNVLGEVGAGLRYLTENLPLERLGIAVTACAGARAALSWTLDYVRERRAFGKAIADFQHTRFVIAEMITELDVTQTYVDEAVRKHNHGLLTPVDAAKAKWWATEMHTSVVDRCVQLFGGYGYMREYPIARAYADARVTTIYGGTTEIMKHIIAKDAL